MKDDIENVKVIKTEVKEHTHALYFSVWVEDSKGRIWKHRSSSFKFDLTKEEKCEIIDKD
jgi:hypothetical protein